MITSLFVCLCLFVYSLCNNAVNNWSYTASDGFDDNEIYKVVCRIGCGLVQGIFPVFGNRDRGKP